MPVVKIIPAKDLVVKRLNSSFLDFLLALYQKSFPDVQFKWEQDSSICFNLMSVKGKKFKKYFGQVSFAKAGIIEIMIPDELPTETIKNEIQKIFADFGDLEAVIMCGMKIKDLDL